MKCILLLFLFITSIGKETITVDDRLTEFLNKIRMLESTDGLNTNHPEIQNGIHKGQSAYGSYGLMPNTIQEFVNRAKMNGQMDENLKSLYHQPDDVVKGILTEKPDIEEQLAELLAEKVLQKSNGDSDKAAYGWKMGHNQDLNALTPEQLDSNQYVQRFRSLRNKLGYK